jgi:hypothetical protein
MRLHGRVRRSFNTPDFVKELTMLNERVRAATMVARQLSPAEADIDTAMASLSALMTAMLAARAEANLSPCVGQEAFDNVGEATALLFKARSKVIDAHLSLHQVQADIGLAQRYFGTSQGSLAEAEQAMLGPNVIAMAA